MSQEETPTRVISARDRRFSFGVALVIGLVYLANGRVITEGDSIPARYLPFSLWGSGSLTLDPVAVVASRHKKNTPYWIWRSPEGHRLSIYPIVTPLLIAPLYVPAVAYLNVRGWEEDRLERVGIWMEKLTAAALCAASAGLLFLLLRRTLPTTQASILTIGYALGTSTWPISSQALWQHGTAELLLVIGLLAVTADPPRSVVTGLAAGLLIANRPPDALFAGALLLFLLWRFRQRALFAFLAAAAAMLPFLYYNLHFFHSVWGGYGAIGLGSPHPFYRHPVLQGLAGILVSPAKGLFVFSPFLLFLFRGVRNSKMPAGNGTLAICLATAATLQLIFYARTDWRGAACYGPRFLADALPALVWLVAYGMHDGSRFAWRSLACLVAISVVVEGVGSLCYPNGRSDDRFYPPDLSRQVIAPSVWAWRNFPFFVEARGGIAEPGLFVSLERFVGHAVATTHGNSNSP